MRGPIVSGSSLILLAPWCNASPGTEAEVGGGRRSGCISRPSGLLKARTAALVAGGGRGGGGKCGHLACCRLAQQNWQQMEAEAWQAIRIHCVAIWLVGGLCECTSMWNQKHGGKEANLMRHPLHLTISRLACGRTKTGSHTASQDHLPPLLCLCLQLLLVLPCESDSCTADPDCLPRPASASML